jgi:hypothetical protein
MHVQGVDHSCPRRDFELMNGDLLVMRRNTQEHWHHRVPKAKARRPRININFRCHRLQAAHTHTPELRSAGL